MLRAVIFDFDGVITDSEILHLRSFNRVFAGYGIEITTKDNEEIKNNANLQGIDYVIFVGSSLNEPATIYDVSAKFSIKMTVETFIQKIKR